MAKQILYALDNVGKLLINLHEDFQILLWIFVDQRAVKSQAIKVESSK